MAVTNEMEFHFCGFPVAHLGASIQLSDFIALSDALAVQVVEVHSSFAALEGILGQFWSPVWCMLEMNL